MILCVKEQKLIETSFLIKTNKLSGPYLCGHFHTLNGMVNEMYASHREGSLELEVGDFKDNRLFRVAAIDHGIFSFVDVKLNDYPIILITNPKSSKFYMPGYEPLHRIEESTHIRVLVYSISVSFLEFNLFLMYQKI